jgi:hypothetical protein
MGSENYGSAKKGSDPDPPLKLQLLTFILYHPYRLFSGSGRHNPTSCSALQNPCCLFTYYLSNTVPIPSKIYSIFGMPESD